MSLKNSIASQLATFLPGLFFARGKQELARLRLLDNSRIDAEVTVSEGTSFIIEGKPGELAIKAGVYFRKFCNIMVYPGGRLLIHENVFFNNYCSLNCLGTIEIGSKTVFGEGVKMYDHNHSYHYEKDGSLVLGKDDYTIGKISIGKNCWIGSNVTILNNVTIGDNTIIGANCLVYKSVPANSIVKHQENLIITQSGSQV